MRRSRTAVAMAIGMFVLFFSASSPGAAQGRTQTAPLPGLDEYIEAAMRDWAVPGLRWQSFATTRSCTPAAMARRASRAGDR